MLLFPKKIHHLIRYFLLIAVISLAGYIVGWFYELSIVTLGPPIFISQWLKSQIAGLSLELSLRIPNLAYLIPITLLYFGISGFLLKELWNERGAIRHICIIALSIFLVFVHFLAWNYLTGYYLPNI